MKQHLEQASRNLDIKVKQIESLPRFVPNVDNPPPEIKEELA